LHQCGVDVVDIVGQSAHDIAVIMRIKNTASVNAAFWQTGRA
jgi:hypothetical protein